ncbi:gamma-glutamylcyclotransferase [Rhodobacteraceae bacterium]|nr:gamma-glutamylcyclotransferase [Paracoccaceae bacterium]
MNETLWIFGYGSLIWNPGFAPSEQVPAQASGWRRTFCMRSIHYRGTTASPGLVLALDADAKARIEGLAMAVPASDRAHVLDAVRARELISNAYREISLMIDLCDGRRVRAITYVIERTHPQYCDLPLEAQARIIAQASGSKGPNRDYLVQTADHLRALGVHDPDLEWLVARVGALSTP